jgi:hypothetical protein
MDGGVIFVTSIARTSGLFGDRRRQLEILP